MAHSINPPDAAAGPARKTSQPVSAAAGLSLGAHGLSGHKVRVEFLKTKDQEPRDIFVGVNDYQARIKRGTVVEIPVEVFEVLKGATYLDREDDEDDPDKFVWVEKQRYPFNVHSMNA